MIRTRTGGKRGVLACAALLLAALASTFPILPALSTSEAALATLERSRARHRALEAESRSIGALARVTYNEGQ
ncbi:MAG: hypothetical protein HYY25_03580 [Candidatus Wallbacteria bacterium]|nr:hypothetical protein [Candidatus Wallbacteria bacterium]